MLPFAGGIEGMENGALVFAGLAAILYLLRPAGASGPKWALIKTLPVGLFAFLAFRLNAPWLLVVGLAMSALGDWFLAFEGDRAFLGGLASFFLAHVAYIALFVAGGGDVLLANDYSRLALAAALVVHAVLMGRKLFGAVPGSLKVPVIAYVAVISLMGLAAAAYGSLTILSGALFFALSDTLLAIRNFLIGDGDPRRGAFDAGVWVTYIAAQALILFGFIA
jgi:uncharacterized membrane protein YhhN